MRPVPLVLAATLLLSLAHAQEPHPAHPAFLGFDRNVYPGDAALPELRKHFAFAGYWLTNPPETTQNTWLGKREILLRQGFGFLVVANGRLDKEILTGGRSPAALARDDAAAVAVAARHEGFPPHTILFLDQEEGGVLLPEQAAYLLEWTETIAASGSRPGVYASGQPVPAGRDAHGKPITITTIQDIRARVARAHLHEIAIWVTQDTCPPAPGCSLNPPSPEASGTPEIAAWQYSQSPRRKSITQSCAKTYDPDGSCYTPAPARFDVDLSVAPTHDPSTAAEPSHQHAFLLSFVSPKGFAARTYTQPSHARTHTDQATTMDHQPVELTDA